MAGVDKSVSPSKEKQADGYRPVPMRKKAEWSPWRTIPLFMKICVSVRGLDKRLQQAGPMMHDAIQVDIDQLKSQQLIDREL